MKYEARTFSRRSDVDSASFQRGSGNAIQQDVTEVGSPSHRRDGAALICRTRCPHQGDKFTGSRGGKDHGELERARRRSNSFRNVLERQYDMWIGEPANIRRCENTAQLTFPCCVHPPRPDGPARFAQDLREARALQSRTSPAANPA